MEALFFGPNGVEKCQLYLPETQGEREGEGIAPGSTSSATALVITLICKHNESVNNNGSGSGLGSFQPVLIDLTMTKCT